MTTKELDEEFLEAAQLRALMANAIRGVPCTGLFAGTLDCEDSLMQNIVMSMSVICARMITIGCLVQLLHRFYPRAPARTRDIIMRWRAHAANAINGVTAHPHALAAVPLLVLMAPPALLHPLVVVMALTWRLMRLLMLNLCLPLCHVTLRLCDLPPLFAFRLVKAGVTNALSRLLDVPPLVLVTCAVLALGVTLARYAGCTVLLHALRSQALALRTVTVPPIGAVHAK